MCGLVGFLAPHLDHKQRATLLTDLLRASQKRGPDATGIAFVTDSEMQILKKPLDANKFCQDKEFLEKTQELPPVVMGHTRAASRAGSGNGYNKTTGDEKLSGADHNPNNHPFFSQATGIALAHNGFLDRGFWEKSAGDNNSSILLPFESTTDSEVALRVLEAFMLADGDRLSLLDCIDNLCLNVSGSYAYSIVHESDPNSIWLVKKDKPLFVAWVPSYKAVIFASEKEIITTAITDYEYEEFFGYITNGIEITPDCYHEPLREKTAIQISINLTTKSDKLFTFQEITITPTNSDYDFHKKVYEKKIAQEKSADKTVSVAN